MPKEISTKLRNIEGLFSYSNDSELGTERTYIIPPYQRAYTWQSSDCSRLFDDIESYIEENGKRKKEESGSGTYFFGTILINADDHSNEYNIIDGQQRITTFMLLLKALLLRINDILTNSSFDEESEKLKDGLNKRRVGILSCLYAIDEDDSFDVFGGKKKLRELDLKYENRSINENEEYKKDLGKILYGEDPEEIEEKVIQIKHKRGDNRYTNFYRNFKFFREKLSDYDSTKINTFARTMLKQCQVIVIISHDTEEAIEMFHSLNSKGMPLEDADIISAILYRNYPGEKNEFEKSWKEIKDSIEKLPEKNKISIDDILNQYMYILKAGKGEKDRMPGVRKYFIDINKDPINNPVRFVGDFDNIIGIWQDDNINSEDKDGKEILNLKQILFKLDDNFKFYYAAYFYYNKEKSASEKLKFVTALLKLFALLRISDKSYSSSNFKTFLFDLNSKIGTGFSTTEIVDKIEKNIQNNFDKNAMLKALKEDDAHDGVIYLNEYLFARETGRSIDLDKNNIQIEHIMPQRGRNHEMVMDDAGIENDDEFNQYVDKLGNKILLEGNINKSISDDWFRTKKQKSVNDKLGYKDSAFPIAASLVNYPKDKWEKEDIGAATEKAAKRIIDFIFD